MNNFNQTRHVNRSNRFTLGDIFWMLLIFGCGMAGIVLFIFFVVWAFAPEEKPAETPAAATEFK